MPDDNATLTAIVSGVVQGVGFRAFVQRQATQHRLRGWARNLPDGRVEVVAQGSRPDIDALRAALHQGPRFARVDHIDEEWSPREDIPASFITKD